MSKKILTIWFDSSGNMLHRAATWMVNNAHSRGLVSEDGEDFTETFIFDSFYEYKASRVIFISKKSGRKYSMFLDDFGDALKLKKFQNNEISGRFRYVKKGQAQGFKFILTDEERDFLIGKNI